MSSFVTDTTTARFGADVLQRSRDVPVVVDFWAAWCGPCKTLGPILEKAADDYEGAFHLVKVDVDANQDLARQFGVQGIPTVVAFRDGKPVARFTGALPDRAVREWLDALQPTEADLTVDRARDAELAGDMAAAEALFREVVADIPDHLEAGTGLAGLLIARGATDEALGVLDRLPATGEVEKLRAAARVTQAQDEDIPALEAAAAAAPDDPAPRLELARALAAKAEYEPALDNMLAVVASKGDLKEEARLAMLDIFELLGNEHPLTQAYRKQLANALF